MRSDACLEFASTCKYFNQSPLPWIEEEFPDDRALQFMVMQLMANRLSAFEAEQEERRRHEQEKQQQLAERRKTPVGSREPVAIPTPDQVKAQLGITD